MNSPTAADLDAATQRCLTITSRGNHNLHDAARLFGEGHHYRFFLASYAAMRVLDDAIDEDFLELAKEERAGRRDDTLVLIDQWRAQVAAAQLGQFEASADSIEPEVFGLLSHYLSRSQLGTEPFEKLAASMRSDVEERGLNTWEDFFGYCEGASVAPGSVFIYLLACEMDDDGISTIDLPESPMDYAREMALFCYLTHILRDLPEDAQRDPQLLTLPTEMLQDAGFDREGFRSAVQSSAPEVERVRAILRRKAGAYSVRTEKKIADLAPNISTRSLEILRYLYGLYHATFESLREPGREAPA